MGIEAGDPESNTFKAKKRDLQQFIDYLQTSAGTDSPDQWTKSVNRELLAAPIQETATRRRNREPSVGNI